MKKGAITGFLLLSLVILLFFGNGSCQNSFRWNITYTVEIYKDGSATVEIEKITLLKDKNETSYFEFYYISEANDRQREFSGNVSALINLIFNKTGRECPRSPVTYFAGTKSTEEGTYGIVKYTFDLIGFAEKINETNIVIGDIFVEGFFLLGNGTLKIKCPQGYIAREVVPSPDNVETGVLMWTSTANFDEKQPRIVLEREKLTLLDYLRENLFLILNIIMFSSAALIGFLIYKVKKHGFKKYKPARQGKEELLHEISDEQKVVRLLKDAGGVLTQSKITEKLGCSKAKVSQLLTSMEKRGILKRRRQGREKVVTLIDESKLHSSL
ncbi:hypothetical protein DRO54_01660 [Candidatus Bathyarchaeota archaeon]|nr:MAG: hypothetical protein DRO54_01660 [Candidatus Bathyarchaeota archaeon]